MKIVKTVSDVRADIHKLDQAYLEVTRNGDMTEEAKDKYDKEREELSKEHARIYNENRY